MIAGTVFGCVRFCLLLMLLRPTPANSVPVYLYFCAGQIEHFVDPKNKKHPKFPRVADKEVVLFGQVCGHGRIK